MMMDQSEAPPDAGADTDSDTDADADVAVPLLDQAQLAVLRDALGPATLASLVRQALAEARQAHDALAGLPDRPGEAEREEAWRAAHKLRGAAGNLGLARVEALARAIEARVADGGGVDSAGLVARLGEAVAATRDALLADGGTD